MIGIAVPIVFFIVFAAIIKILSDNKTKRILIEKGMLDENVKYLYGDRYDYNVPSSLKWGMVFTAIGLAIIVGRVLGNFMYDSDQITIALMFVFGGMAMILYYFIAKKMNEKAESQK
ncbi:MAG: hypothetical protein GXO75_19340 [Calditrichaeota bacterium]|nr:hypothetical protein [Calditrichota bacterium]